MSGPGAGDAGGPRPGGGGGGAEGEGGWAPALGPGGANAPGPDPWSGSAPSAGAGPLPPHGHDPDHEHPSHISRILGLPHDWRERTLFGGQSRARIVYLVLVTAILLGLAYRLRAVLNPLLVSLLLAYILDPAVRWLESRSRLPRTVAILAFFVALGGLVIGVGVYAYGKTTQGLEHLVAKASGGFRFVPPSEPAEETARRHRPVIGAEAIRANGPGHGYLDINGNETWDKAFEPELVADAIGHYTLAKAAEEEGWQRVPGTFDRIRDTLLERYKTLDPKLVSQVVEKAKQNTASLYSAAATIWEVLFAQAGDVFGGFLTAFSYLVLVPVYTFFLLSGFDSILVWARSLLPRRQKSRVLELAGKIDRACAAFFRGRFLIAMGKGIATWLGLWAVGIDFALLIGMLAGALSIVPVIGPAVGIALSVLVSYAPVGWGVKILSVVVVFVIVEVLEAIANPLVLGREVGLHPVTILLALFAFGDLFGLFGLLLAVPLGAIAKILAQEFLLPELRAMAAGLGDLPPARPPTGP